MLVIMEMRMRRSWMRSDEIGFSNDEGCDCFFCGTTGIVGDRRCSVGSSEER